MQYEHTRADCTGDVAIEVACRLFKGDGRGSITVAFDSSGFVTKAVEVSTDHEGQSHSRDVTADAKRPRLHRARSTADVVVLTMEGSKVQFAALVGGDAPEVDGVRGRCFDGNEFALNPPCRLKIAESLEGGSTVRIRWGGGSALPTASRDFTAEKGRPGTPHEAMIRLMGDGDGQAIEIIYCEALTRCRSAVCRGRSASKAKATNIPALFEECTRMKVVVN